ncbi:MAG: DNA gyrase inhibitor YacG [Acidobacteriota bacterium]
MNRMKCPICKKDVKPGSAYAPFCSDRCRLIDLGNWSSEKYRISSPVEPEPEEHDDERHEDEREG